MMFLLSLAFYPLMAIGVLAPDAIMKPSCNVVAASFMEIANMMFGPVSF